MRLPISKATKFNELGFGWFQVRAELSQTLGKYRLDMKCIFPVLETDHEVERDARMVRDQPTIQWDGRDES
ncbi:MAG: hypothetical protein ACYDGU_13150 [Acidiferrobacterales bacterium]